MSKTQSDTGREGGLDVNKKVEKKQGRQDTRADRGGAGRDRAEGSRVRSRTSPGTRPTQDTRRHVPWWVDEWMDEWGRMGRWMGGATQRPETKADKGPRQREV